MRVLAIRGRNLASLAGDFEVDFEAEPLADAGIFAITGPTGAGKSTLLDAMCLALFDAVPRLGAASSRTRVENAQGDDLTATDPRAILRHGEGDGFAEVDFVGRDGERYRARWSVQRARQKADGRMQASKQSLVRLSDQQSLSDRKGETLAAIHDLVGLSAEQFRRAVLLAQGDFEAFIRADENERAALLERLTGSQIYTELGKAAYAKANDLRAKQQGLQDRIAAQNGLDDEARTAAETRRDTAQDGAQEAGRRLSALEADARWESDRTTLLERVALCEAEARRTSAAVEEAAPRRESLRRTKTAHAFAAEWSALGEARQAADAARVEAEAREAALTEATGAVDAAEALDREARAALAAETDRAARLAPELDRARMLDRQIGEAQAELSRLTATHAERTARLERGRAAEAEAADVLADMVATRDDHAAWLADHGALGALAPRESELAADCDEHRAIVDRIARYEEDADAARVGENEATEALTVAEEALVTGDITHAAAQAALVLAEAEAPSPAARAAAESRRDGLIALTPLLLDARNKAERAGVFDASLRRLRDERTTDETERAALTSRQADLAGTLPALRHRLDEAKRAGALAEAASDEAAARLRATLIDGEPCPVCGSTDHALTAIGDLLGRQLAEQRDRIATLETEIGARDRDDAGIAAHLATLALRARERESEAETLRVQQAAAMTASDTARALLADKAAAAGLDAGEEAFEQQLATALVGAETERRAMETTSAALTQASATEKAARDARETARTARDDAAAHQRVAHEQLTALSASMAHASETRDRLGRQLDAGFGAAVDWRTLPDPRAWLATQTGAWRTRRAEQADIAAALPRFEQAVAEARTVTAETSVLVQDIETQLRTHRTTHDAHARDRAMLLEGRPVTEVETLRAAALALLREGQEATQARLAQAKEDHASSAAHRQAADRHAAQATADHARRDGEFKARIATQSLTEAEVAEVAAQGAASIEREEAALSTIDTAARDAAQALTQRRADLATHEEHAQPAVTGQALTDAVALARTEADAAQAALTEAQFAIRRDDEVRAQTAALRAELERERETSRVWLALSGLIGDAEGKKFRRFAQGLTLDRLLAHANDRLTELKPRYALERGTGADMLIQVVDQDMAGEVRGVHNLSGGERFLISLALALGLAEMSTGRGLRIESLFIDEGFGALDTASLGQAIAVLEHLHASRRRVGVISHVEEVKERIPVKIEVTPVARGKSRLGVVAG